MRELITIRPAISLAQPRLQFVGEEREEATGPVQHLRAGGAAGWGNGRGEVTMSKPEDLAQVCGAIADTDDKQRWNHLRESQGRTTSTAVPKCIHVSPINRGTGEAESDEPQ